MMEQAQMMEQALMQDDGADADQDLVPDEHEQMLKAFQDALVPPVLPVDEEEAPPAVPAQQHLEVAQDDEVPPLDGVEENPPPVFQPQQQPGWSRF
jgi:hypothetical protein